MPRPFTMDTNQYYLKMNSDPFLDSVLVDVVDLTGKKIQTFLTISSLAIRINELPKEVTGKLGMYADMQVMMNGKKMALEAEAPPSPIQIITTDAAAA